MVDVIELDRRAVERSVEIVSAISPEDMVRPTPCDGWTLRDLIEHMIAQHDGFARAAGGERTALPDWHPEPAADPVAAYTAASERVTSVFAADGVLEREFFLPELTRLRTFSGTLAVGFHFIDYVVHSWDLARAVGIDTGLDDELVTAAVPYAHVVPDNESRGAAFARALEPPTSANTLDQIVAYLGRDPAWSAPPGGWQATS